MIFLGVMCFPKESIGVQAVVLSRCFITTMNVNFGTVNPLNTVNTNISSNNITVRCTKGAPWAVGLSNGSNYSSPNRRMKSTASTSYLPYQIYTNSSRTSLWLNPTGTTPTPNNQNGTGTGGQQILTGYYTLFLPQSLATAGSYSDTITATINY